MLSNANLWRCHDIWAKVASTACYSIQRSPHSSIDFKIIEEVWSNNPVDFSILRVFGCLAYAHVNDGKLAPRLSNACFLVMHLSPRDIAYGALVPKRSFKVGILLLMNLLCFLLGKSLLLLLVVQMINKMLVRRRSQRFLLIHSKVELRYLILVMMSMLMSQIRAPQVLMSLKWRIITPRIF